MARSAHLFLIVGQVALTTILLLGAGLLTRSFVNLVSITPGYEPRNVVTFQLPQAPRLSGPGSLRAMVTAQHREIERAEKIVARLQSIPGVQAAAFTGGLPMVQMGFLLSLKRTANAPPTPIPRGKVLLVGRDYFKAMGIQVIGGRGFTDADRARQKGTFLINRVLARAYFGETKPVGQSVYLWGDFAGDIVGIVDDVRQSSLDTAPEPQLFMTAFQTTREYLPIGPEGLYVTVRTDNDTATFGPEIRRFVREIDPGAPVNNMATMDQIVANSITTPRFYAVLLGLFAVAALALASAGLYGILAYFVRRRTQEIGVRMALGAQPRDVLLLVVRQGLGVTCVGIVIGLAGGAGLAHFLEKMLFGLAPLDPTTFVAVPVLFAVIATLACLIPARHATKVEPLVALRYE